MADPQSSIALWEKILAVAVVIFVGYFLVTQDSTSEVEDSNNTGAITSFEECIAAGNPAMESYPRQCRTQEGQHFVEDIEDGTIPKNSTNGLTMCPEVRPEFCTQQYDPVCGLVRVQCVTTPCPPIPKTFGNACTACSNQLVESYTEEECEA